MSRHWRYYNPQPQCSEPHCARFIPYERATLCQKSDGMPFPSPVEYWVGICEKCEAEKRKE